MNTKLLQSAVAKLAYCSVDDGTWARNGLRPFYEYRDLGLREASAGQLKANHIRIVSDPGPGTGWHCHDSDFQMVYVLAGFVRLQLQNAGELVLRAHDCAYLPAYTMHDEV